MKKLIGIFLAAGLFACSEGKRETVEQNKDEVCVDVSDPSAPSPSANGYFIEKGDSIELGTFEVVLTLSEQAEELLDSLDETIIVRAYFWGNPIDSIPEVYKEQLDMMGLNLGSQLIELTDQRVARFDRVRFSKALYGLLSDGEIELLINVYSGRKGAPDNLLDMEILEGKMSTLVGGTFELKGKLIGE